MLQYDSKYVAAKEAAILKETDAVNLPIKDLVAAVIAESLTNPIPENQEQSEERTMSRTVARFAVLLAALSNKAEKTANRLVFLTWGLLLLTVALLVIGLWQILAAR